MPQFFIDLDGASQDETGSEFDTIESARDAAIVKLGAYLQEHPEFAYARHWRVDVRNSDRRLLLHVVVATVDAPQSIDHALFQA